jgi:hypothetical protein
MSGETIELYARIHDLVTLILQAVATDDDCEQLCSLLRESPVARKVFDAYIRETTELKWHLDAAVVVEPVGNRRLQVPRRCSGPRSSLVGRGWRAAALLLVVSMATAGAVIFSRLPGRDMQAPAPESDVAKAAVEPPALISGTHRGVATLTRVTNVVWSQEDGWFEDLARLGPGDTLRFDSGEVELVFDTGVEVLVRGPADFEIKGPDRAFSRLGSIAARVGDSGKGFTIETPTAEVVDVGTEFGVEVQPTGSTAVAVFRGRVDLSVAGDAESERGSFRPLFQGEAVRVGLDGALQPMVAIASDRFPEPLRSRPSKSAAARVIAGVKDNRGDEQNAKFYRIVRDGLREDSPAYVDRNHEWNGVDGSGIPACVQGIEYIMPFNDDKFVKPLEVSVELLRPATLYVFFSDTLEVPDWLRDNFVDTGLDIGLDEAKNRFIPSRKTATGPGASVDTVFSIWKRDVREASTVTLGSIRRPPDQKERKIGFNMYGIAAAPLDTKP